MPFTLPLARLCVHLLTASGTVLAFFALRAAEANDLAQSFVWLIAALIIDGVDGIFARLVHCSAEDDIHDGALLDLIVDYLTYVFIPVVILGKAQLLPEVTYLVTSCLILLSSALYFANKRMKTPSDDGFQGFPAVWNIVIFYLVWLKPAALITTVLIVMFAGLQFVRFPVAHPFKHRAWRALTLLLTFAWIGAALITLHADFAPPVGAIIPLIIAPLYYLWSTLQNLAMRLAMYLRTLIRRPS